MDENNAEVPEIQSEGTLNEITVWDKQLDQPIKIPRDQLADFAVDSRYALRKGSQIDAVNPEGDLVTIPSEEAKTAFSQAGFRPATSEELRAFDVNKKFGDREAAAAMAGVARGLTVGLSDVALTKTGLVKPETLAGLQEASPKISALGEAVGVVAPVAAELLTGVGAAAVPETLAATLGKQAVAATPAALVTKAGAAVTRKVEQALLKEGVAKSTAKTLIQKLSPAIAGSAVEGAIYGAGQLLSEDALGKADLNAENLLAHVGTGAVLGGAFGAGGELLGAAASKVTPSIKSAFEKGPLEGFTNPQKALVKLMRPGEPIERAIRDYSASDLERMVQLTREEGLIKPIMSKETLISNLDNKISTLGDELRNIKAVGAETAKAAGVDYSSAAVYKDLASSIEDKYIKPMGLFADDFTEAQIKAYNKVPIAKLRNEADSLAAQNSTISQQMAIEGLAPIEAQKLQLKIEKNNLKLSKLEDTIDKADKVQKGLFASTSANAEVKAAQEVVKELNLAAKSQRDMPLDVLHKEMRTIDNELEKAYKSGNYTVKQDIMKTVRDGYRTKYNEKVEELVQKNLMPADLGQDLIQKNKDFSLLADMRDTYLKNLKSGKQFSLSNVISDTANLVLDSDFKRRLAISGFMEGANNSIGKAVGKAASAIGTAGKLTTAGIMPTVVLTSSPLAIFANKKPKTELEAYQNIGKNLNDLANPEKALDYSNKRTLKLATFAPKTAAAMDAKISAGLAFLNSKFPKNVGPRGFAQKDAGVPRDSEFQKFKRYYESVMNPQYAIHAVITGTAGTPELESLQAVYPEIYQQLVEKSTTNAIASTQQPTYQQRQMLSKTTKVPADASYNNKAIRNLQRQFLPPQKPGPSPRSTNIHMENKYATDMQRIIRGK